MIYNRNIYDISVCNSNWFYPNWKWLTKHLSLSKVLRMTCVARYLGEVFSRI